MFLSVRAPRGRGRRRPFAAVVALKRGWVAATALAAAAALIFLLVSSPAVVGAAATDRQLPVYCVRRDQKVAALTFDAAWGNEDTAALIDILDRYHVRATFFVVGEWVDKYPESVRQLAGAGHEVMNHSDDHAHFSALTAPEIIENVQACSDKIAAVTGVRPTLFRPPYGEYDDNVIATIRGMGMEPIQWDVDSLDWKEISAGEITERVLSRVQPGSIVLFHNAALHTPEALPAVIEGLIARGYTLVPVSELLLPGETAIESDGRQVPVG